MKQLSYVLDHHKEILGFLKSRFPMYHQSNFFFRDVQYGIMTFMERKEMKVSYPDAEMIAREFVRKLEKEGIFLAVDRQTWAVNYPEYRKPVVKAPAAKPAATAPPAQRPPAAAPGGAPAPTPAGPQPA
jgi:hypothetical protein